MSVMLDDAIRVLRTAQLEAVEGEVVHWLARVGASDLVRETTTGGAVQIRTRAGRVLSTVGVLVRGTSMCVLTTREAKL